ncbi:MAG: AAA family ATPase, partial [Bacilli bacterium]|nr:AAA family ATPase [Bacilli bacterium]
MYIDQLRLKSFRNYDQCAITLTPGINIFIGKNGQGKTNLLESIYFMSTTKSHRNIEDVQLIKLNEE